MPIEQKYFHQDKNYLLKTVQAFGKEALLGVWTKAAYESYMVYENPMGLEDDFTLSLKSNIHRGSGILDEMYDLLAAVYRFKEGDNQLTFMWDGRTHMEFYDEEWKSTYSEWISALCLKPDVYRAIIKASLADKTIHTDFLSASIKRSILDHFKIRLTRAKRLYALVG